MKLTLKNIKTAAWNSRDSSCFRASLYLGNKRVGTVSDDGNGAPLLIEPLPGKKQNELFATLKRVAKELNPQTVDHYDDLDRAAKVDFRDPQWWRTTPQTWLTVIEMAVHRELDNALWAKDLKRAMQAKYLVSTPDGMKELKKRQPAFEQQRGDKQRIAELISQVAPGVILNFEPFEDALKIYREAMK